ncbi:MAG: TonB-dependent receptor [Bacteroidales bacterium]|nr:TonB-dependent receptor [Bacteroidales bacterium]MDD4209315.1 TonB-dependent receptor [Bacteroidales bacterium]
MCVFNTNISVFLIAFCCFLEGHFVVFSQENDTITCKALKAVIISAKRSQTNDFTSVNQTIDSTALQKIPAQHLADALKFLSGVQIKDYGGIGGLKTISVRSLGANHTGVVYDGIMVSDYQSGQINLGRFSLENISSISLSSGNNNDIFQSARVFASANVLQLYSENPIFEESKYVSGKVSFRAGSFGLLQPMIRIENRITKNISTSLQAEYIYQKGDYPYRIQNGDSMLEARRAQADLDIYRIESNFFIRFKTNHLLKAKVFYYHSQQGLPGAVVFYAASSAQRMKDKNIFTQFHYLYVINKKIHFQSNAKWNYSYINYLDSDYLNVEGKLDISYFQRELYFSNVVLYMPFKGFSVSYSNDLSLNAMSTSESDFVNPYRYSYLNAASFLYEHKQFNISATLLHTYVHDVLTAVATDKARQKFTPSVSAFYKPFKKEEFYIKVFYKNIYRMPTFNDLYYRLVGNNDLKPENTHQVNVGLTWIKYINTRFPYFSMASDVYYNKIKDKIIAVPNKNLFIWTMLNLGEISIIGIDAELKLESKIHKHLQTDIRLHYTYQLAIDVSDSNAKNYKHQIPYTPRHTASGILSLLTKHVNITYTALYVGNRYVLGQNTFDNLIHAYWDHGLALYRTFSIKKIKLSLRVEMLNISNKNYEVIKNYPMAGRQFQGKISLEF